MTFILLHFCQGAWAQNFGFNARTSAEIDWKVFKGLHINADYELRMQDSFSGIERQQISAGATYKLNKYFKAGLDYTFIGHYKASDGTFCPRHRVSLNLTGNIDMGDWRISLRERIQLTHKAYSINAFQEVRNPLTLKSRIQAKYRGFKSIEPYAYIEFRNIFNAPGCSATYSTATGSYSDYEFQGYNDAYINRLRGTIGVDWNISKHHSIDFGIMANWCRDRKIDTNKEGTRLKSYGWERSGYASLCIGYKFSF